MFFILIPIAKYYCHVELFRTWFTMVPNSSQETNTVSRLYKHFEMSTKSALTTWPFFNILKTYFAKGTGCNLRKSLKIQHITHSNT